MEGQKTASGLGNKVSRRCKVRDSLSGWKMYRPKTRNKERMEGERLEVYEEKWMREG